MAVATPYIARDPIITITSTTPDLELVCHARTVRLTAEDNEVDVDTFCNPDGTAPGSTKWTFECDVLQSFGDGATPGIWNMLYPLAKTVATFQLRPDEAAISTSNPEATFDAWVPTIPFVDSERGDSTILTMTFSVVGSPTFDMVP
jgi:hypothetical protein